MGLRRWYSRLSSRKLTIMVIPDTGAGGNRDYVVKLRTVLLAKIGAVVVALLLLAGGVGMVYSVSARQRIVQLQTFNNQLRRERRQIARLREQLAEIWVVNERLRGMLGGQAPETAPTVRVEQKPWVEPLATRCGPAFRLRADEDPELGVYLETAPGALVVATASGRVLDVRWSPIQGDILILDHGEGLQTRYAKNVTIFVRPGDYVVQGQTIGIIEAAAPGTTPVLFYQVLVDGRSIDPTESLISLSGALPRPTDGAAPDGQSGTAPGARPNQS